MSSYEILLSNSIRFAAVNSETILYAAKQAGYVLENSCNNGQCGVCSCVLLSGKVDNSADKLHTKLEKEAGAILTCQAIPLSDIEIDIEELGEYAKYPPRIIPARVSSINLVAKDVLRVTLRTPPSNQLLYFPGQYVDLIHGSIRRSYSVSNKHREDGSIDLLIKKTANGEMSDVLFHKTNLNDLFRIEGPLGTFGWRDSVKNNVVFMVTGTGVAPAASMLEALTIEGRNIFLIWGNRFKHEFFELTLNSNNFQVHKVLSREYADGYKTGYVQDILLSLNVNLADTTVFACGSVAMINASRSVLVESGLDPKSFYSDSFVSSGN
jgi:CDP-4-dehydro-6-deoxyglucose reductase